MSGKVYDNIFSAKAGATKTEQKLIDRLLSLKPEDVIYLSITELSELTGAAEATILRFCRKLGYQGYQDFKLILSQDVAARAAVCEGSAPERIAADMTDAINQSFSHIDYELYRTVAKNILASDKIMVFGVGNSSVMATAAKYRLIKAGLNVDSTNDPHIQAILAANMSKSDIIVLISVSGSTHDMLRLAEIAKQNGVPLVVITNYLKSPLAKTADFVLYSSKKEAAVEGGALATVVSQAYIVDVLCSAVFELLGEQGKTRSIKASKAVQDKLL